MIPADRALLSFALAGAGAVVAFLALRSSPDQAPRDPAPDAPPVASLSAPAAAQLTRCGPDRTRTITLVPRLAPDAELARYLALDAPSDLNEQRFDTWVGAKAARGAALRAQYEAIVAEGDTMHALVAISRLGMIAEGFAQSILAAEIPASVRSGAYADENIEAFCESVAPVADQPQAHAIMAYAHCASRGRSLAASATNEQLRDIVAATQPCLDALAFSSPEKFPALEEMFQAPEASALRLRLGIVENATSDTEYDRHNTRGVALRIAGDFAGARAAYTRAAALDTARPEAHFNLGLLEQFEANAGIDLDAARAHYRRAVPSFITASARAVGEPRVIAMRHMIDAQKALGQLDAFITMN